jgi:hypothetical protein
MFGFIVYEIISFSKKIVRVILLLVAMTLKTFRYLQAIEIDSFLIFEL